jgi:UDP-glucose 4-epimerase
MPKVVVFGGAGYLGSSISQFMKKDFGITVADIKPPNSLEGLRFEKCDVRDPSRVKEVLKDASVALYLSVVQIPQINTEKSLGYQVNVMGLQNACEATMQSPTMRGLVHSGTWHVFGEKGLEGVVDESYGFRPDNVEERAKIYALCKITQESIIRLYAEMGASAGKTFSVIRTGTVLGEGMPEPTAASIFIRNGLKGEPLTPFANSMYRPMLYVDLLDVCRAYSNLVMRILNGEIASGQGNPPSVVNLFWPVPITILELAELIRDVIKEKTNGRIVPPIQIKQTDQPALFGATDKDKIKVNLSRAKSFLGMNTLTDPRDSIRRIVQSRISSKESRGGPSR